MKNKLILTISLLFSLIQFGWAQTIGPGDVQQALYVVQQNAAATNQMYQMAQWQGNYQEMQLCEFEANVHQTVYNNLVYVLQTPYYLQDPQHQYELATSWQEYAYRVNARDWNYSQASAPQASYSPSQQTTSSYDSYRERTRRSDASHKRFIDSIRDESAYSNPDTGDVYKVDSSIDDPHLVNGDGSTTELSPYDY